MLAKRGDMLETGVLHAHADFKSINIECFLYIIPCWSLYLHKHPEILVNAVHF